MGTNHHRVIRMSYSFHRQALGSLAGLNDLSYEPSVFDFLSVRVNEIVIDFCIYPFDMSDVGIIRSFSDNLFLGNVIDSNYICPFKVSRFLMWALILSFEGAIGRSINHKTVLLYR